MSVQSPRDEREPEPYSGQFLRSCCNFYNAKIVTMEPVLFLFLLSYMLYTTIIEQYYFQYYGAQILSKTDFQPPNGSYCINSTILDDYSVGNNSYKLDETDSNDLLLYTELASKLPAIVVTLLLAPITDRYGRKWGILIPSCGFLFQSVATILIIYFTLNPYYLIAVSGVSGLCGDFAAMIASSFAYVADITSVRRRSVRLAIIGGFLSFGQLVGVLSSGYWLTAVRCNFIPVIIFQAGALALIILYTLAIPESLTKFERLALLAKKKGTIFSKYIEGAKLYCSKFSYSVWAIHVLTLNLAVLGLNVGGSVYVGVYFLKAPPFEFTSLEIGYYQAFRAAAKGIGNTVLFFLAMINVRDSWVVLYGTLISATGNIFHGLANKAWQIYTVSGVKGTESVAFTTCRSLASKQVKPEEQGSLFGIISSVESLAALMASVVWPYAFPLTINHNMRPGSTFLFMGGLEFLMIPLILSILLVDWKQPKSSSKKKRRADIETSLHTQDRPKDSSSSSDDGDTTSDEDTYKPLLTSKDIPRYSGSKKKW